MSLHEVSFEREGHIYLVAPVMPVTPTTEEVAGYEFAKAVSDIAPNPNIAWYRGQYVEADNPNRNGAMWASEDLAIASVTPMLMPVTVMHDPSTAVGLIADTRLMERSDTVPRARIDNVLALWKHRFPEVAEEAQHNYEAGTLMQSMECRMNHYECSDCGKSYVKLPGDAERANWCPHLRGEVGSVSSRILRGVCFTGTGLIFGSRGARGAYDEAHLEPLMDEVAEFHQRARTHTRTAPKPKRRTNVMEIEDREYAELVAAKAKLEQLEPELATAQTEAAKVPDLQSKLDAAEIAQKSAETERDTEKAQREKLEESASQVTLASERTGKLGKGFVAKLPETVKTRLDEQAKTLSDEDWTARVDELAEMLGVKPDEAGSETETEDQEFQAEEVARAKLGGGDGRKEVSPERRSSVVAGLMKPPTGAAS